MGVKQLDICVISGRHLSERDFSLTLSHQRPINLALSKSYAPRFSVRRMSVVRKTLGSLIKISNLPGIHESLDGRVGSSSSLRNESIIWFSSPLSCSIFIPIDRVISPRRLSSSCCKISSNALRQSEVAVCASCKLLDVKNTRRIEIQSKKSPSSLLRNILCQQSQERLQSTLELL